MKISYNWLKDYLDIRHTPEEVGDLLTNVGLEVEAISRWQSVAGGLEGLTVGYVKEVWKHPNADKLSVTKVSIGDGDDLQIVCGARNVAAGQKVIVATPGITLYPFKGEPFKIKQAKIRGESSDGMICAEDEIGLSDRHDGILVLAADAPAGMAAKEWLRVHDDFVFEIGLTPNRGDAMSHIGTARDLAACLQAKLNEAVQLHLPEMELPKPGSPELSIDVSVENTEACTRYSGLTLQGITVGESPAWLQDKLRAIGMRPVNNVVDVTNFVMLECGQPLHAFDADAIAGKKIVVKSLPGGTPFRTLDDKAVTLAAHDLMICSAESGLCIAGVYGGLNSGVTPETQTVFLESACFNPRFIRRTSTRLGLRTDAALHFEKGTDPNGTIPALTRAAALLCELCGGSVASGIVDVYPAPVDEKRIFLPWEKLNRIAGAMLPKQEVKTILSALQFELLRETDDGIEVATPTFKTDVTMAEDVMEEVLRIYGLEKIPTPVQLHASIQHAPLAFAESFNEHLANTLAAMGFREIMTNSVSNSQLAMQLGKTPEEQLVKIISSANAGLDSLRDHMIYNGLEAIAYNLNRQQDGIRFFELGKTYRWKAHLAASEKPQVALWQCGNTLPASWSAAQHATTFFSLKGNVNALLTRCNLSGVTSDDHADELISGIALKQKDKTFGILGEVKQPVLQHFDIRIPVFFACLSLDVLQTAAHKMNTTFRELPKYPAVRRDLALILDKHVTFSSVESIANRCCQPMLEGINLFDVYEGDKVGEGKKSYAVSFLLRNREKTLTDREVEANMERLIRTFESELGAVIRK